MSSTSAPSCTSSKCSAAASQIADGQIVAIDALAGPARLAGVDLGRVVGE
jgi:hypothetical protein